MQHPERGASHWALTRDLEEIAIEFTTYCNLSCTMCSVWRIRETGLPIDLARSTLDQAQACGAVKLTPCGAESFTRRDIIDIFEYAESIGFEHITVVTNGLLLDKKKLDRLQELRTIHLNVSIDGPPQIHDALRGSGAHARVVRILGELQARAIPFGISSVLMRPTLAHIEQVMDLAAEFGATELSLQPYQVEIGGAHVNHDDFRFRPEDETSLRDRLELLISAASDRGIHLYTEHLLEYVPAYLARGIRPIPKGGCFVPSRFLLVDYKGDVYPCFFMRGRAIGNVFGQSLFDLWHSTVQRELNMLALAQRCPGCLAACSDVPTYDRVAVGRVVP